MKEYLFVHLTLLALLSLPGCAGAPQCVRSSACGGAAVCGADGACGPLGIDAVTHAARATWLVPARLALRGTTDDGDAITLGPSSTLLLSFADLPLDRLPLSAELVLSPVASRGDVATPARISIDVVRPFSDGGDPDVLAAAVATRDVAAGPARVVRIDVSELARAARVDQLRSLDVAVRVTGGPLRIGSIRAGDARSRPRLELLAP